MDLLIACNIGSFDDTPVKKLYNDCDIKFTYQNISLFEYLISTQFSFINGEFGGWSI